MPFDVKSSPSMIMLLAGCFPRMLILDEERHKIKEGLTQATEKQYKIVKLKTL